uniref:C3H1-type domain-containing protein n=1 Tax=Alexandrium monilatum TaxID=311494 RepID=A0A7S4RL07_9DINO
MTSVEGAHSSMERAKPLPSMELPFDSLQEDPGILLSRMETRLDLLMPPSRELGEDPGILLSRMETPLDLLMPPPRELGESSLYNQDMMQYFQQVQAKLMSAGGSPLDEPRPKTPNQDLGLTLGHPEGRTEVEEVEEEEEEKLGYMSLKEARRTMSFPRWGSPGRHGQASGSGGGPAVVREGDRSFVSGLSPQKSPLDRSFMRGLSPQRTPLDSGWMPLTREATPIHPGTLGGAQAAWTLGPRFGQLPQRPSGGSDFTPHHHQFLPPPPVAEPSGLELTKCLEDYLQQQKLEWERQELSPLNVQANVYSTGFGVGVGDTVPAMGYPFSLQVDQQVPPPLPEAPPDGPPPGMGRPWPDTTSPLDPSLTMGSKLPAGMGSADVSNSVLSRGSLGHPHSCGLACKYVWRPRGCKDGERCKRCHVCRWRRATEREALAAERASG